METTTNELVAQLALLRNDLANIKKVRDDYLEKAKQHPTYQATEKIIPPLVAEIENLETELRQRAIAEYQATGAKKPHPALGIRVMNRIAYDLPTALDWARKNLVEALTLDKKLFEAHAKGVAKTQPIPCVQIQDEITVTIASDLKAYLPDEQPIIAEMEY